MIDASAIQKIVDLAPPAIETFGSLTYTSRPLVLITPPTWSGFTVSTLDGLVDLLLARVETFIPGEYVAFVTNETRVDVVSRDSDLLGRRAKLIEAYALTGMSGFPFGQFLSQENFLIGLAAQFQQTDDRDYLIGLASQIDLKEKIVLADDGISQNVTTAKGMAFKETVTVRNRVSLAPYRTFREVAQPASEFVFRARDGGMLALYEADGGAWKIAAIQAVAAWLKNRLAGVELGDLPVIS